MSTLENGGFPLPEVARSLSPYISTRQEALQIRRTLTVYLTSLLKDEGTARRSPLSLAVPGVDIQHLEIPSEASGLLKEYLKEMQAHLIARREFCAVTAQGQDHPPSNSYISPLTNATPTGDGAEASAMPTYLALLRQRRRYEKLRILRDYMDVLLTKPAAKAGYLNIAKFQLDPLPVLPVQQPAGLMVSSRSLKESVDELVLRLEKAVLRAKNKLENEQKLFMRIKARQQSGHGIESAERFTPADRESRGHALHQTRQELINWVEQELSKTDVAPDTSEPQVGINHRPQPASKDTEQRILEIQSQYGEYIEARKNCLATVAEATSMPSTVSEDHALASSNLAEQSGTVNGACCSGLLDSYMRLLVPLNLQRLIAQQKTYMTSTLAKEHEATIQLLNRLADESHLLSAYPLLVTDSRFQKITAALGSKLSSIHLDARSGSGTQTKTIEMASRWAFAANAAKTTAQDALEEKIAQGTDHMGNAQEVLSEVVELLGQRARVTSAEKQSSIEDEDDDIWAPSTSSRVRKGTHKPKVGNKDSPRNIWHGLRGDLGSHIQGD